MDLTDKLHLHNCDNMEFMATIPDKYFELAIVDPPYGIGISSNPVRQLHTKKKWDNAAPNDEYFLELKRISKNQIIWGGNYFKLPPTQNYIVWDKVQPQDFSLAMCELAWCSIQNPMKIFRYSVLTERGKQHPTQKPVALYKWLLSKYAKQGDKIFDSHLGSMSIAIACHDYGFDLTGCELDIDYYNQAIDRVKRHIAQPVLFEASSPVCEQQNLF